MYAFRSRATLAILTLGLAAACGSLLMVDADLPTAAGDCGNDRPAPVRQPQPVAADAPGPQPSSRAALARIEHEPDSATQIGAPLERRGSAVFRGRVTAGKRGGIRAQLTFMAGANQGEALTTDADGTFGAGGLHPGFSLISVCADGVGMCTRPISLLHGGTVEWNLDFGPYGLVTGHARDQQEQPILGASVALDGAETTTDPAGFFSLPQSASGDGMLVVTSPGFASHSQTVATAPQRSVLDIRMERGCCLELTLGCIAGAMQPATVYLVPIVGGGPTRNGLHTSYPWHLVQPLRVVPGATVNVADLPRAKIAVHAVHARAKGVAGVWLHPDGVARVALEMEPVAEIRGKVVRHGQPVAGAIVVLESAQPMRASLRALGDAARHYRSLPFEILPPGRQEVRTDGVGAFVLGDWQDGRPRLLNVTLPGEKLTSTRTLRSGERRLEIELNSGG